MTKAAWDDPESYAPPPETGFWSADRPQQLGPRAFGVLPPEFSVFLNKVSVTEFKLAAPLPKNPAELPVYVVGRYPASQAERFRSTVRLDHQNCSFVPEYSEFLCPGDAPPGSTRASVATEQEAEARARDLLRDLWMPDLVTDSVLRDETGGWRVVFMQRVNGLPIYVDRPWQVSLNRDGQMTYAVGRRRPLTARSLYPVRSPQAAWQDLTAGRGLGIRVAAPPEDGTRFEAVTVELAYVVTHATTPREIMQPYYVFRNDKKQALFVPAVADPYVERP